ncbi:MAG: hypothetical protein HC914_05465 [Chloroflexaceae bacterium]|nr:hypothetical protein [Chloroflexaceae bacterium]
MKSRRVSYENDIPGLTAWFTSPFIPVAVGIIFFWLVQQGFLSWQWWGTWALSSVIGVVLLVVQVPLYRSVLQDSRGRGGPISSAGCLAGLYMYGICIFLGAIAIWQFGIGGGLLSVLLTPMCCFSIAWFITSREPKKRRR